MMSGISHIICSRVKPVFFFYEITMIMEKVMIVIIIVNITVNIFNWPAFIIKGRAVFLVHSTEVLSLAQSMRTCSIEYEHTVCDAMVCWLQKKIKGSSQ